MLSTSKATTAPQAAASSFAPAAVRKMMLPST